MLREGDTNRDQDLIQEFLNNNVMIDCWRMSARITKTTCASYFRSNGLFACTDCLQRPPGVRAGAPQWTSEKLFHMAKMKK
ncbi:MAG: hypothetical protein VB050_18250 [Geobacteraceae bacterium]|nr:hypothetical protein [Geobacteraceae bacterium]